MAARYGGGVGLEVGDELGGRSGPPGAVWWGYGYGRTAEPEPVEERTGEKTEVGLGGLVTCPVGEGLMVRLCVGAPVVVPDDANGQAAAVDSAAERHGACRVVGRDELGDAPEAQGDRRDGGVRGRGIQGADVLRGGPMAAGGLCGLHGRGPPRGRGRSHATALL